MAEARADAEISVLVLVPFTSVPRVAFDNIKLGKVAVRKVKLQNPGQKPLRVRLESVPEETTGFEVDYSDFSLPGRSEAVLRVGWVPQKHGNLREKIKVKYGSCFTQIMLVANCPAPPQKVLNYNCSYGLICHLQLISDHP